VKTARFTKRIENFICENCGATIEGKGFTNHCPHCLWSKHVDINPGDRLSECTALMEPIGLKKKGKELSILHRCKGCGSIKPNKVSENDERELLLKLPIITAGKSSGKVR